jgi:hypothetical protein
VTRDSRVDQFDTIVATHGGVEIRWRGKESGIGFLEVRLPHRRHVGPPTWIGRRRGDHRHAVASG